MASMNQVVLIGRVGNDIKRDLKYRQDGSVVGEVRLAVNRPTKDEQGQYVTDFVSCKFYNKHAEILAEYVIKGDLLSVTGSLNIDTWEDNGTTRQKYFIKGENFQMLSSKSERAAS